MVATRLESNIQKSLWASSSGQSDFSTAITPIRSPAKTLSAYGHDISKRTYCDKGRVTNHLKDDFLWDGEEEQFEAELRKVCLDYIQKARGYRPTQEGRPIPPAVIQTTDDQIVEELTDQATIDQLTIMEVIQPLHEEDPAVRLARAEMFRASSAREPRTFDVGKSTHSRSIIHKIWLPQSPISFKNHHGKITSTSLSTTIIHMLQQHQRPRRLNILCTRECAATMPLSSTFLSTIQAN